MSEPSPFDAYSIARLTGGMDRVLDTALVVLVQTGRVRVRRNGRLTVVERSARDEVEQAVLGVIESGYRTAPLVRAGLATDPRLGFVTRRLVEAGQLVPARIGWRRARVGPLVPTASGRRLLEQLRAAPPAWPELAGTGAAEVAVHGWERMADAELRAALFEAEQMVPLPDPYLTDRRTDPRTDPRRASRAGGTAGSTGDGGIGMIPVMGASSGGHGSDGGSDGGGGCGGGGGG